MTHASSTDVRGPWLTPTADDDPAGTATPLSSLAGYHIVTDAVTDATQLPAIADSHLYNYLLAGNGLFLQAERRDLAVLMRIAPARVRGLPPLRSRLRLRFPRVPVDLVREMVRAAADAAQAPGGGLEALAYLRFVDRAWRLARPPQEQAHGSVRLASNVARAPFLDALIDVHSHPFPLRAFSATDDESDRGAFRFAVLIADPAGAPSLHARLCVYGAFLEVPPSLLFELPEELGGTAA